MEIGNKNKDSNFNLACIVCGSKEKLHNKAHRNEKDNITGYILSCEKCSDSLIGAKFGIWDAENGKAII